jgi:hypothetical protein
MLLQMQVGKLENNVWGHKQFFFTCDEMKVLLEEFLPWDINFSMCIVHNDSIGHLVYWEVF